MHRASILMLLLCAGPIAGCMPASRHESDTAALVARDPVVARALFDPLLTDPDLASRNEANAAIGFVDSAALPVFTADSAQASAAREALRIELLEGGPLPELPLARADAGPPVLGPMSGASELLAAVGAPQACAAALREDFLMAADLPAAAAIPAQAMVVQAGGADRAGCNLRIVRYDSEAPADDLMQYHVVRARRAGLAADRYVQPAAAIVAAGANGERLAVHLRARAGGLTGVTLVWRGP